MKKKPNTRMLKSIKKETLKPKVVPDLTYTKP